MMTLLSDIGDFVVKSIVYIGGIGLLSILFIAVVTL